MNIENLENIEDKEKIDVLMKSRKLVNTSYDITYTMNKIFMYILFNFQINSIANDGIASNILIEEKELKKLISKKSERTTSKIEKIFENLMDTKLFFIEENEELKINNGYVLVAGYEITDGKKFQITIINRVYEYLIKYNNYAPLQLDIYLSLKTFYSQRFYELFRMWSKYNVPVVKTFTLDFLRAFTGCRKIKNKEVVEEKYPTYKSFKQRVLTPSLKNLMEIANIEITYKELKVNRKVEKIEFTFIDKNIKKYDFSLKSKNKIKDNLDKEYLKMEKYVKVPAKQYFDDYNLKQFTKYCYENAIIFTDSDLMQIFFESLSQLSIKTGISLEKIRIDNIKNYTYFKNTIDGKINDYLAKIKID